MSSSKYYKPTPKPQCGADIEQLLNPNSIEWRDGLVLRAVNWLGDTLITLPAVYQLQKILPPECKFSVVCQKSLMPIWQAVPWVSKVIGFPGKRLDKAASCELRKLNAGVGVIYPNSFGAALDLAFKGVPIRLGRAGRGRDLFLSHRLPKWQKGVGVGEYHQVSHYLDFAAAFGINDFTNLQYPSLKVKNSAEIVKKFKLNSDKPILVLAPGAAYGPAKQWPIHYYKQVAQWWHKEHGIPVVLGTNNDKVAGNEICAGLSEAINLAGATSMSELLALLQLADFVVANDSGAMHLAAALGSKGVAIFGSTDPIATGPLGADWIVVQKEIPCAPCFQRTCERADNPYECLKIIMPKQVIDALLDLR